MTAYLPLQTIDVIKDLGRAIGKGTTDIHGDNSAYDRLSYICVVRIITYRSRVAAVIGFEAGLASLQVRGDACPEKQSRAAVRERWTT